MLANQTLRFELLSGAGIGIIRFYINYYSMNKTKGFTLIELLVVIAIIGILSSVVLASLNTARGRGANAAVKANLANIRAQAEIVYDGASPNSYATMCADGGVDAAITSAENAGGGTAKCFGDGDSYVVVTELKAAEGANTSYCVDSAGKSLSVTAAQDAAITTANTLCP